jgi:hypothetical protein
MNMLHSWHCSQELWGTPPHINNTSRWSGALLYYSTRLTIDHWLCVTVQLPLLEFFLLPTVSRPVSLGIGPPFGTLDRILACSSSAFDASSLTRERICSLQCNHSLVMAVTPNNYTLPSHLRLCSLSVASYDSQGLRWKYSNPPPHRDALSESESELLYSWRSVNQYVLVSSPIAVHRICHVEADAIEVVVVSVTLQLTVSLSVSLGVESNLGLLTRDLFFLKLLSCHLGAPSLTRGRVCHLSVFVNTVYSSQSVFT